MASIPSLAFRSFRIPRISPLLVQSRFSQHFAPGVGRKQLIIVGTGWGGYSVLRNIDKKLFDVIVVSPRNHFLFTPLLASTTVGTLEFRSIIEPVRNAGFRRESHFHLSEAVAVDPARCILKCRNLLDKDNIREYDLKYDDLVIAVGAVPNTFGTPGVEEHAFFLKVCTSDAQAVKFDGAKLSISSHVDILLKCSVQCTVLVLAVCSSPGSASVHEVRRSICAPRSKTLNSITLSPAIKA